MKTKLFTMIAALGALATLAAGCDKPDTTPSCLIGRGLWIAKYTKVDETGPAADCVQRAGDILNINKYQAFPEQGQPAPIASVAIKPYTYRYVRIPAAQRPPAVPENPSTPFDAASRPDLAFGAFQSNNASNNLCTVPTLSTATLTTSGGSVPADADTKGVQTAYLFSNVQFLDDQTHGGQQMQADLEYHHAACVQHYKVQALFGLSFFTSGPAECLSQTDCDPHVSNDPNRLDLQLGVPALATGINPDYPVYCDAALGDYVGMGPLFVGISSAGVCFLDGPFGTVCDSSSNPDCWKSGPQGSVAP
jgi:hypothetical protein